MDKFGDVNMCRICFKKQDTVFSLFHKRKGASPYEKLIKIGLRADINDTGPSCICWDCLTELETTVNFLEKCERSNEIVAKHARNLEFTEEITSFKENLNVEHESNALFSETKAVQAGQDDLESNCEEAKSKEVLGLEQARCKECGSQRRCRHWSPPATHTCPYCQKVFTRKFNFKVHLKRHSKECEWWCARCGAGAASRWLASRHCAPRPRRACPVPGCGRTYTTNTNLNIHLRGHSGERPFECNDCGNKFSSKNTLQNHIRIHTGVLPYICPICGKQFRTNKLSAHMATHRDARHACARAGAKRYTAHLGRNTAGAVRGAGAARGAGASKGGGAAGAARPSPQHACSLCPSRYHHKQSLNKHVRKQHSQNHAPAPVDTAELAKDIQCDL